MINILSRMNMEMHRNRPLTPEYKKITLWRPSDEFLHCCIESRGCRFNREKGACVMCDYGTGRNLDPPELKRALEEELQPQLQSLSTLLFGSYGSILDTEEISEKCLDVILDFISGKNVRTLIFETHCCTITDHILKKIKEKLQNNGKNIIIEMGYETSDKFVLENCLNKILDFGQLCRAIHLIHKYGMKVSLNVFVGAPFLTEEDQLNTAVESVKWAFDKGADSVVIFPCNIKPFTLVHKLYQDGLYHPVSQWMMIELLARIPEEYLDRVTLSWYGDRQNFYENNEFPLIPPEDCDICHKSIFDFYHVFMRESLAGRRKQLIENLRREDKKCDCYEKFLEKINIRQSRMKKKDILQVLEKLENLKDVQRETGQMV